MMNFKTIYKYLVLQLLNGWMMIYLILVKHAK